MKFIKKYIWFIKESIGFNQENLFWVISNGGLKKAYHFSLDMCKWDKMTIEEKQDWYLIENRIMEF